MLEIWKAIHYHAVGQLGQILGQVGPDPPRCVADETGAERAVRPPARGRTAISPPPIILLTIAPDSPPILDVPTVGGLRLGESRVPSCCPLAPRPPWTGAPPRSRAVDAAMVTPPPKVARPSRKRRRLAGLPFALSGADPCVRFMFAP